MGRKAWGPGSVRAFAETASIETVTSRKGGEHSAASHQPSWFLGFLFWMGQLSARPCGQPGEGCIQAGCHRDGVRVEGVGPTVLVKSYKKYNLGGDLLPNLFQVRLKSSLETWLLSYLLSLPYLPCAVLLMSSSAGQVA